MDSMLRILIAVVIGAMAIPTASRALPSDTMPSVRSDTRPDTVTDTTTALWQGCERVWEQKQRRLYKRWAVATDFLDFNPHKYPCMRNAPVYLVRAKDFFRMFRSYTPPNGSDTARPTPYSFLPRGLFVKGGADVSDGGWIWDIDTVTSHFIILTDSPYKGAREFEELLEGFREHLRPRTGGFPSILLNGVLVKNLETPVDINHIMTLTVMTGAAGTYPPQIRKFYDPHGLIVVNYWYYP